VVDKKAKARVGEEERRGRKGRKEERRVSGFFYSLRFFDLRSRWCGIYHAFSLDYI
jgi:hypothetical protein